MVLGDVRFRLTLTSESWLSVPCGWFARAPTILFCSISSFLEQTSRFPSTRVLKTVNDPNSKLSLSCCFFKTKAWSSQVPLLNNYNTIRKYERKAKKATMAPVVPSPSIPLAFQASCKCGKVRASVLALEKFPPLRLVCYCKDCRGYFETLNRTANGDPATKKTDAVPAQLDNWGGVDWTSLYPRDITILEGQDLLTTVKIREKSPMRQVYSTCCYTPMFRFGNSSVLMNTDTMEPYEDQQGEVPVTFRIIGRDAWKNGKVAEVKKPSMSYSVPFKWFWTMPFRINKEYMEPMPINLPAVEECKVLETFQEGSKSYEELKD